MEPAVEQSLMIPMARHGPRVFQRSDNSQPRHQRLSRFLRIATQPMHVTLQTQVRRAFLNRPLKLVELILGIRLQIQLPFDPALPGIGDGMEKLQ